MRRALAVLVCASVTLVPRSSSVAQTPSSETTQASFAITSDSMAPTLISGDNVSVDTGYYRRQMPHRRELVLMKVPSGRPLPANVVSVQQILVKRIVAVGGDVVSLSGKVLRVNGKDVSEPYAHYEPTGGIIESGDFGPVTVPPNQYFLLGDNRSHSLDSRDFGSVPLDAIVGRPLKILESSDKSRIGRPLN